MCNRNVSFLSDFRGTKSISAYDIYFTHKFNRPTTAVFFIFEKNIDLPSIDKSADANDIPRH